MGILLIVEAQPVAKCHQSGFEKNQTREGTGDDAEIEHSIEVFLETAEFIFQTEEHYQVALFESGVAVHHVRFAVAQVTADVHARREIELGYGFARDAGIGVHLVFYHVGIGDIKTFEAFDVGFQEHSVDVGRSKCFFVDVR